MNAESAWTLGGPAFCGDYLCRRSDGEFGLADDAQEPPTQLEHPRKGKWIWSPQQSSQGVPVRFRKQVQLPQGITQVQAWISADVCFRLWINGRLAARGPADIGRDYDLGSPGPWLDDLRDLTGLFHEGENLVAIEVFPHALVQSHSTTGSPGMKIDLKFWVGESGAFSLGSDSSWLCSESQEYKPMATGHGFQLDLGRQEPWQFASFSPVGWTPAEVEHAPRPLTLVSELPHCMEVIFAPDQVKRASHGVQARLDPIGAVFDTDGRASFSFGKILAAYIQITLFGATGTRLYIRPNEPDSDGYHRSAVIILRDGIQSFELPYFDSFSTINVEAVGVTKPLEIQDVKAIATCHPVRHRGSFECSDPALNLLWRTGRRLTQNCLQTHHLDSPHHQEPISDPGDYLIESLHTWLAFGDSVLSRQDLRKYSRIMLQRGFKVFHTSYALLWLKWLIQHHLLTGDEELLKELAPAAHGLIDQFKTYLGPEGLISEAPNYMFIDWVEIEGFNAHHPPACIGMGCMTAFFVQALTDDLALCRLEGNDSRANEMISLRDQTIKALNSQLWDSEQGLYRDGIAFLTRVQPSQWLPADKATASHSTQINTLAVTCGAAAGERARLIMQKVMEREDLNCQPYFMHFVFDALADSGLFDDHALQQMHRWKVDSATGSVPEMWDRGDLSHAWQMTPVGQLTMRVLGIRPLEPGWKVFCLDPHPLGLAWAKGSAPTPFGDISVSWVLAEKGVKGTVTVPPGCRAHISGLELRSGTHDFVWPLASDAV